jgi:hypothetical protein
VNKFFFIIFLIFLATSCSTPNWYKPMGYRIFKQMPKEGSPGYKLGWVHGCQSGLGSQFGGAFYMNFYTWSKDQDIASSNPDITKIKLRYKKELKSVNWNDPGDIKKNFDDYNRIFWGAHVFCRHSALGTLKSAGMEPSLPGSTRYDPMDDTIGDVWRLNATGDTRIGTGFW